MVEGKPVPNILRGYSTNKVSGSDATRPTCVCDTMVQVEIDTNKYDVGYGDLTSEVVVKRKKGV
jgi:hypothetical protein